jgi:hypothetical protein
MQAKEKSHAEQPMSTIDSPEPCHSHYNRTFEKKSKYPRSQPVERLSS